MNVHGVVGVVGVGVVCLFVCLAGWLAGWLVTPRSSTLLQADKVLDKGDNISEVSKTSRGRSKPKGQDR